MLPLRCLPLVKFLSRLKFKIYAYILDFKLPPWYLHEYLVKFYYMSQIGGRS